MPMLNIMRCPVCGKQSDAYDMSVAPQPEWIMVSVVNLRQETFDTWDCVVKYATDQAATAARDAAAQAATSAV
jgi:hypothetical protein